MTRVLCIPNPHLRLDRDWAAPYLPLELLSGMATVEAEGGEAALFDLNRLVEHRRLRVEPGIWEAAARLLVEAEPELLVLESWTGTLHNTLQLAAAARPLLPEVPFLLAGAGSSALAGEVLARFPAIDGVIRGELEPALARLAATRCDRVLPPAPGLCRRLDDGRIEEAALATVEELESLPRPALHLALLQPGDTIPLEAGRGCSQGCSFCALAGHWAARHRPRAPQALAEEMIAVARRFPGSTLDLTQDPVFLNDPDRLEALCAGLAGQGLRWSGHCRIDRLDGRALERLAAAGCVGILFGVESGSPGVQRAIGKSIDLDRLEPTLEAAARVGIETRVSFVLGFPEEDRDALAATARTLLRARRAGAAGTPVQLLRAYPGSPIHGRFAERLCFEELLCTASAEDHAGRALIREHGQILAASYRVPATEVPRGELLAAWVALSSLPDLLDALDQSGYPVERLLRELALEGEPRSLEEAASELGARLRTNCASTAEPPEEASKRNCRGAVAGPPIDPLALEELVSLELAIHAVGREPTSDPRGPGEDRATASLLTLAARAPERVCPYAAAPWRLLRLRVGLDRLLDRELAPRAHACSSEAESVLVAKVASQGEASYYTRRSFAVECFVLDEVSAELLPLCDGETELRSLALEVGMRLGRSPHSALQACQEALEQLLEAGLLGLLPAG